MRILVTSASEATWWPANGRTARLTRCRAYANTIRSPGSSCAPSRQNAPSNSAGRGHCGSGRMAAYCVGEGYVVAFDFRTGSFIGPVVHLARLNGQALVLLP